MSTENYILEVKNGQVYFNGLVSARSLEILTDVYKGIQESKNLDNSKYWDELASHYVPVVTNNIVDSECKSMVTQILKS